jgi:hypothetical protein
MLASGSQILGLGENVGHEKRNTDYPIKNVESTFLMMPTGHIFSVLTQQDTALTYEDQCRICVP